jgi:hypothetical protein
MNSEQIVQTIIRLASLLGIIGYWTWWGKSVLLLYNASSNLPMGAFFGGLLLTIGVLGILYNKINL